MQCFSFDSIEKRTCSDPVLLPRAPSLSAMLPFELRRKAHLDRPFTPMREGSMDVFPRAAIIPHLEQRRVFFRRLWSALYLRPQRCWIHLGMCGSLVRDCSLYWRLPTRTDMQRFGIDW
jgi:hypothetical protein